MQFNLLRVSKEFFVMGDRHLALDVEITPEAALDAVNQYNYENQRICSGSNVLVLAEAMRRGEFREFTSIDFAVLDGVPHLINGQHTLRAVAAAQKPIWLTFHFSRAKSKQDIEWLYSKFDIGRTRSIRDAMGDIGDELRLSVKERDALAVAVGSINNNFQSSSGWNDPVKYMSLKILN